MYVQNRPSQIFECIDLGCGIDYEWLQAQAQKGEYHSFLGVDRRFSEDNTLEGITLWGGNVFDALESIPYGSVHYANAAYLLNNFEDFEAALRFIDQIKDRLQSHGLFRVVCRKISRGGIRLMLDLAEFDIVEEGELLSPITLYDCIAFSDYSALVDGDYDGTSRTFQSWENKEQYYVNPSLVLPYEFIAKNT